MGIEKGSRGVEHDREDFSPILKKRERIKDEQNHLKRVSLYAGFLSNW